MQGYPLQQYYQSRSVSVFDNTANTGDGDMELDRWYQPPNFTLGVQNTESVARFHWDGGFMVKKKLTSGDTVGPEAPMLISLWPDENAPDQIDRLQGFKVFAKNAADCMPGASTASGLAYGKYEYRFDKLFGLYDEDHPYLILALVKPGGYFHCVIPPGVRYRVAEMHDLSNVTANDTGEIHIGTRNGLVMKLPSGFEISSTYDLDRLVLKNGYGKVKPDLQKGFVTGTGDPSVSGDAEGGYYNRFGGSFNWTGYNNYIISPFSIWDILNNSGLASIEDRPHESDYFADNFPAIYEFSNKSDTKMIEIEKVNDGYDANTAFSFAVDLGSANVTKVYVELTAPSGMKFLANPGETPPTTRTWAIDKDGNDGSGYHISLDGTSSDASGSVTRAGNIVNFTMFGGMKAKVSVKAEGDPQNAWCSITETNNGGGSTTVVGGAVSGTDGVAAVTGGQGDSKPINAQSNPGEPAPVAWFDAAMPGTGKVTFTNTPSDKPVNPIDPDPLPPYGGLLTQITFHENYYGGGKTTVIWGADGAACGLTDFRDPLLGSSRRKGWNHLGWCTGPSPDRWEKSMLYPNGYVMSYYDYFDPDYTWVSEHNLLTQTINRFLDINKHPPEMNLYEVWAPDPTHFDANGGYFESKNDPYFNVVTAVKNGRPTTMSAFVKANGKPSLPFWPSFVSIPVMKDIPVRDGYEFTGWYVDPKASIPVTINEEGLQPGRTYYAGWRAQKVTVNYYDTREGYGFAGSQEYNYDDLLKLLSEPAAGADASSPSQPDTSGQHFANWATKDGKVIASGTKLNAKELAELIKHESSAENPDGIVSDMASWTLDLYTQWNEKTTTYTASVVIDDLLDNDGCRPTEVVLGVVSSVTNKEVGTITIDTSTGEETYSESLANLPITTVDASVEKVTYRIYLKSYTDIDGDSHTIQNTTAQSGLIDVPTISKTSTTSMSAYDYALDNINRAGTYAAYNGILYLNHSLIPTDTDIKFTIEWDDMSDTDGVRPETVFLRLYADGKPVDEYIQDGNGFHNAAAVSVGPGMCEVSDNGNVWTYTFKDYQKYKDGHEIRYTVQVFDYNETEYTCSYIGNDASASAYGCKLTHRPDTRVVPVEIHWADQNNRDHRRPDSVDIRLTAYQYNRATGEWDNVQVTTRTLNAADFANGDTVDTWRTTFNRMYVNNDGEEIMYIAEVISDLNALIPETLAQYTWTTTGSKDEDGNNIPSVITISRQADVQDVLARVEWADTNNNDSLRASSVILELYADGKPITELGYSEDDWRVILSGDPTADEWTYTYKNMPVHTPGESGHEIVYTVRVKEAHDGDIYGEYEERGVLGEGHEFTKYIESYPGINGNFVDDFALSTQPVVRLTHELNQIEVPVKVTWMDQNNRDGQRSSYVTLALTAYQWNDETYKWEYVETATQTVKADGANTMTADEWTASFGLRNMYHDGVKIIYHLAVVSDLNEYLPEGSYEYGWAETAHGNQVDAVPEVTVSQNVNTTSTTATVFWDDSNNQDNIRAKNIILQLYAHAPGQTPEPVRGEAYRVNLSGDPAADNWTYTFSGMPKYAAGQSGVELIYTVRAVEAEGEPLYGYYIITANGGEEEVLRYEASYLHEDREAGTTENTLDADLSDRAYVKLSHICETKTMNFSVNWHDDDDRDAMRMSSVSVDLYKTVGSGEPKYLRTLVITAGDNGTWTYKVTGLPGYEGGQPVKYTIEIPEDVRAQLAAGGYTATTEDNIVHLYHTPETGEISTQLYWSDEDDNDGYRPDSVVAALYANGTPTGRTTDLNEGNGWSAAWTGLNAHYNQGAEHGLDVVYSVVIEAPEGYAVAYNPETTTIERNETLYIQVSHAKDTAEVPVKVFWNDADDTDRKRPENITVQLIADGKPTDNTLTLSGSGDAAKNHQVIVKLTRAVDET